jgi:hypothetical protein
MTRHEGRIRRRMRCVAQQCRRDYHEQRRCRQLEVQEMQLDPVAEKNFEAWGCF